MSAGLADRFYRCDFMHWAWDGVTWRNPFTGASHDRTCHCGRKWDEAR